MGIGTLGEWVGGVATAAATFVALYFGARDQDRSKDRHAARREIHAFADLRLLQMDRWAKKLAPPDGPALIPANVLDRECAGMKALARRLSRRRAKVAERIARAIYGDRSVDLTRLYPDGLESSSGEKAPYIGLFEHTPTKTLFAHILETDATLLVDNEEPLRISGARGEDATVTARLREEFERLAKV